MEIDVRIADLSGTALGLTSDNTIWLDRNAAGWGWYVDQTPWEDSEFADPDDRGEANRIDLLTVLLHEMGHVFGRDHERTGVMAETLPAGERRAPDTPAFLELPPVVGSANPGATIARSAASLQSTPIPASADEEVRAPNPSRGTFPSMGFDGKRKIASDSLASTPPPLIPFASSWTVLIGQDGPGFAFLPLWFSAD